MQRGACRVAVHGGWSSGARAAPPRGVERGPVPSPGRVSPVGWGSGRGVARPLWRAKCQEGRVDVLCAPSRTRICIPASSLISTAACGPTPPLVVATSRAESTSMMVPQVQLRAYQSGSSTSPLCAPPVESGSCCECCSIFRGIGALGGGVWVLGGRDDDRRSRRCCRW